MKRNERRSENLSVLVSINCITYNHEDYIADAIESFLMQNTDFNFEIIIGEDCSTDHTKEIVEAYKKLYPNRVKLITSDQNVGIVKNQERVFENSKGKYIAVCEGDDYWSDPYKLQKQVDYLEENPDCTLCFHSAKIVQAPKKSTGRKIKSYSRNRISPIEDIISGGGGFCPTASLVYPRKLMENPPAFYKTSHVGDYPAQLILASEGYAYYINDCMSVYRTDVKGSWTSNMDSSAKIKEKMIEVNEGDIQILVAFNKYTNFKHHEIVEKVILEKKFAISIIRGKIKSPKSDRYKEDIDSLSIKKKIKIILFNSFPRLYVKLAEFKNFFYT